MESDSFCPFRRMSLISNFSTGASLLPHTHTNTHTRSCMYTLSAIGELWTTTTFQLDGSFSAAGAVAKRLKRFGERSITDCQPFGGVRSCLAQRRRRRRRRRRWRRCCLAMLPAQLWYFWTYLLLLLLLLFFWVFCLSFFFGIRAFLRASLLTYFT